MLRTVYTMFLNEDAFNLSDDEGAGGEDMRYAERLLKRERGQLSSYFSAGGGGGPCVIVSVGANGTLALFYPCLVKPDHKSTPPIVYRPPLAAPRE